MAAIATVLASSLLPLKWRLHCRHPMLFTSLFLFSHFSFLFAVLLLWLQCKYPCFSLPPMWTLIFVLCCIQRVSLLIIAGSWGAKRTWWGHWRQGGSSVIRTETSRRHKTRKLTISFSPSSGRDGATRNARRERRCWRCGKSLPPSFMTCQRACQMREMSAHFPESVWPL